jgi:DNA-binding transcriptional regulator YiaG
LISHCDVCYKAAMRPRQVKKLRKDLGLTQQQLAERIGAARESVARWETGKHPPRGANLKALRELVAKKGRRT